MYSAVVRYTRGVFVDMYINKKTCVPECVHFCSRVQCAQASGLNQTVLCVYIFVSQCVGGLKGLTGV